MNLSRIMTNIYGTSSSQSFDNVVLGGSKNASLNKQRLRYLDTEPTPEISAEYATNAYRMSKLYNYANKNSYSISNKLSGGYSTLSGGAQEVPIVDSPMYVKDADLEDFIKHFYLYYHFSNLKRNTIIVVPDHDELAKLKKELDTKLSGANIKGGSLEASKFASKESLGFKRYIFDIYGSNVKDKDPYRVDSAFPQSAQADTLRRTNRLSEVLYFKFNGANDILVSTSSKLEKPTKLKLLAKCARDCFILKGSLPSQKAATSKSAVYTVSGGNLQDNETNEFGFEYDAKRRKRKTHRLAKRFLNYVDKYNDIEKAAYKFVGSVGLSAVEKGEEPQNVANRLAKLYSGDFLHSAMSILAAE